MLGQPGLRCEPERGFNERHVNARFMSRTPGRAGVRPQRVGAVHLRQGGFVNHNNELGPLRLRFTSSRYLGLMSYGWTSGQAPNARSRATGNTDSLKEHGDGAVDFYTKIKTVYLDCLA